MKKIEFREAEVQEAAEIWQILQAAIQRRKEDGSKQWQNGYPNIETVLNDIAQHKGFVLYTGTEIIAYGALSCNDEPAYEAIEGKWLSQGDYVVIHRVAVAEKFLKQGFAKRILLEAEKWAADKKIQSIKMDTNFDNAAMLRIVDQLGYKYCGTVMMNGAERKAFEKIITI